MLKANELRSMSEEELEELIRESYVQRFKIKNTIQQEKKNEKPHRLREIKKTLARGKTIMHERRNRIAAEVSNGND